MRKAKIVATLGPASRDPAILSRLIRAGVDVARLNFSHGTHAEHEALFHAVRAAAAEAGRPVAILADLCGPKLRLGKVEGGAVLLEKGATIEIVSGQGDSFVGTSQRVSTSYDELARDVRPGHRLLIDDGRIVLRVKESAGDVVTCQVEVNGVLKDKKGLNLPGVALSVPSLTPKDRDDLRFATALGVDYFALSFVRCADDVRAAKLLAGDVPVIAKIEKPEAIDHIEEIVDASDGVMVARGDLGVEAGFEKVPLLQKRIIRTTNRRGKVVITATQMLESMVQNPAPTRAEVSDVANAVLDGTDALMLSGETAAGAYPVEAVEQMDTIIREVEGSDLYASLPAPEELLYPTFSTAIADAAVRAARDIDLKAIAVYTETGHSAAVVSEYRPRAAIVALSSHQVVLNRLALQWGVLPLKSEWVETLDALFDQAERVLVGQGLVTAGDSVAITFGMERGSFARTNTLKLWTVGAPQGQ
ncbi:MAG: pyruvate kinase [Pseudomonadota bacterium]